MILAEIILILLYLVDSPYAFLFAFVFFATILFQRKTSLLQRLVRCMIYSSPLFSISVIGNGLHQVFSWVILFLTLYTFSLFLELFSHRGKSYKILDFSILLLFLILFLRNIFNLHMFSNLEELFQMLFMIIPLYFTFLNRDNLKRKLSSEEIKEWLNDIKNAVFATAIAVIFQYISYKYMGIMYGNISLLNNRIIFDFVFKGYSVLSIFLSVGVVLYCNDFFDRYRCASLFQMFVVLISIAINSSRAGLMGALLVCAIIFLKHINNKKTILFNLFILIIGIIVVSYLISQLTISRGDTSFLVSSGRESTYLYAFDMIQNHLDIFFFGGGLSSLNYTQVLPHSFLLQFLLTMGIFVTTILAGWILALLKYVRKNQYFYILLAIVIGGLFITDFHSNVFFTIFAICGIITSYCLDKNMEGEDLDETGINISCSTDL